MDMTGQWNMSSDSAPIDFSNWKVTRSNSQSLVSIPQQQPPPLPLSMNFINDNGGHDNVLSLNEMEQERRNTVTSIVFGDVLDLILKNSETRDLFNFRLVNKHWSTLCHKSLYHRKDNEMEFTYCPERNEFFLQSKQNMCDDCSLSSTSDHDNVVQERSLSDFTDFLCVSMAAGHICFPCVRFRFNGGHMGSPQVQTFFNVYGPSMTGLSLDMDMEIDSDHDIRVTDKNTFYNLIFTQVPNLRYLNILSLPRLWEITEIVHHDDVPRRPMLPSSVPTQNPNYQIMSLPHLVSLEIGETSVNLFEVTSGLIKSIISAAPNIQQVYFSESLTTNFMPLFVPLNSPTQLHLLKLHSLNISLFQDPFIYLEQLSHLNFPLRSLNLEVKDMRMPSSHDSERKLRRIQNRLQCLSRILERSRGSMDHLGLLSGALELFMRIDVPRFPNIQTMYLDLRNAHSLKLPIQQFPCRLWTKLEGVFPQLSELTIDVGLGFTNSLNRSNDNATPFRKQIVQTLRSLSILGYPSPQTVQSLTRMFPAVEKLTISEVTDFPQAAQWVWAMKKLKHLKLQFLTDPYHMDYQFPAFDVGFTGFDRETVMEMRQRLHEMDFINTDLDRLNGFRVKRSMLDLPELESLDVKFVNWEGQALDYVPFLSDVTTKCIFEQMENLDWNIYSTSEPMDE